MNLKERISSLKKKLNEHAEEVIIITTTVSAATCAGLAVGYKLKFKTERKNHLECHGYAMWVDRMIQSGDKKLIWKEGGTTHIVPVNLVED